MNIFKQSFIHSIKLPNKKHTFALNRVGMDVTMIYLFIIIALSSIPALTNQLIHTDYGVEIKLFFTLMYFFIFYYLTFVVIVLTGLSIFAYVMTLIVKLLQRKLTYAIIWKMSAFAATIPFLAFTLLSFFIPLTYIFVLISLIYMTFIVVKIILIYPPRRK